MAILRAFDRFAPEAALIGRMLAGYADLEIDMMSCVKVAIGDDLDTSLKALFRCRGETQRIDVADALARHAYRQLRLDTQFSAAIGAVRRCLTIRNRYAHCTFWDDNTEQLAFTNLENLAKQNRHIADLRGAAPRHLNLALLQLQFGFFERADDMLVWVLQEGLTRLGKPAFPHAPVAPAALAEPPESVEAM